MLEKKNAERGYPNQGCQNREKMGKRGVQIAMIRVQAVGLYVERVGNLYDNMNINFRIQINVKKQSELKPQIRVIPPKKKCLH